MEKKIRIALIGCGRRSSAWLRTIQLVEDLELVAICDMIEPRVRERMGQLGNKDIACFTDHRKLMKELDFDAAAIVTEPEFQAPLSIEFMKAGKDVISEVPVTYSIDECWDLVLTVERTGRLYYLGEQVRHSPMAIRWREMVQSGKLGKILFAEGHYLHGMTEERFWIDPVTGKMLNWQDAAGNPNAVKSRFWSLANPILYAPHELSPLLKVLDDRVVKVSCFSTRTNSYRMEEVPFAGLNQPVSIPDLQVAMMHTEKDTIIRFAAGFSVPVSENHWYHLFGTKGEIETRRGKGESDRQYFCDFPLIRKNDSNFERSVAEWTFEENSIQRQIAAKTGHDGLDYWPVYDFAQVLLGRKPVPDINVYQAVETAAPVIMAVESLKHGGALREVPDFRLGTARKTGQDPRTINIRK
jgi:predicted dehydrogenase